MHKREHVIFRSRGSERRKHSELVEFLQVIDSDENFGKSVLGLNVLEAQQVLYAIGQDFKLDEMEDSMKETAKLLRTAF
jgi:hypothetical protein